MTARLRRRGLVNRLLCVEPGCNNQSHWRCGHCQTHDGHHRQERSPTRPPGPGHTSEQRRARGDVFWSLTPPYCGAGCRGALLCDWPGHHPYESVES